MLTSYLIEVECCLDLWPFLKVFPGSHELSTLSKKPLRRNHYLWYGCVVTWVLHDKNLCGVFYNAHYFCSGWGLASSQCLCGCHVCLYCTLSCLALKLHQYVFLSPRYLFALPLLLCAWAILYIHLQVLTRESFSLQSRGGPSLMSESIWIVRLPG